MVESISVTPRRRIKPISPPSQRQDLPWQRNTLFPGTEDIGCGSRPDLIYIKV